jgi:hypothetical protein
MDLLKAEDVSSIKIFDIRVSESEIQLLSDALAYLLRNLDDKQINRVFTEEGGTLMENIAETRNFVEDRYNELMSIIISHCRDEFLPKRFQKWRDSRDINST